ncbi:MAG: transcriptional regulator, LuxR family [Myxococcaceae bacterium]|nr:transcriptional regulator, LuxR family [Myxococcaceae bacterium]
MSTTRIGPFLLDHVERTLSLGQAQVAVQPKVIDCIELLATRAGQLTTSARLRRTLWPDLAIGEDALRQVIAKARAALRTPGSTSPAIRARKGLGYVLEATVEREVVELAAPAAGDSPTMTAWPIVGRERELTLLRNALAELPRGHGSLCLVAGEAGAGKSALLEALSIVTDGPLWLVGHCQPGIAQPAFWPFRQLTQRLAQVAEDSLALARAAKSLCALFATQLGAHTRPASAERRLALAQSLSEQLRAVAELRPLCLVLEDLHWADSASLLLLEMLARDVHQHPLMVLATYRLEAASDHAPLRDLLARLGGRSGVTELLVPPLSIADLRALLTALSHPYEASGAARELHRLTGGNALFARLLLRDSALLSLPDEARPASLAHVVQERVRALPRATAALLSQAAGLGTDFSVALLADIAQLPHAEVLHDLDAALHAGLLERVDHATDQLHFVHALVCEVLYEQLSSQARADLHRRALAELLRTPAWQTSASQLASHAFLAGGTVDPGHTRTLCELAGRESFDQLAFDQAALHLSRALALAPGSSSAQHGAALSLLYAQACWEADLSSETVSRAFHAAAAEARKAASPRLLAEAAIGSAVGVDSPSELYAARLRKDQLWPLEEAYALLGEHERAVKQRVARTLCWMCSALGDSEAARRWAQSALDGALPAEDAWSELLTLGIHCTASIWDGDRTTALTDLHAMRRQVHAPALTIREQVEGRLQLMTLCLWVGEPAGYRSAASELPALVQRLPQPPRFGRLGTRFCGYALLPSLVRMTQSVMAGDFAGAHQHLSSTMADAARLGFSGLQEGDAGIVMLMPLLQYQGRSQILTPMLELAKTGLGELPYALALSSIALERGSLDEAARHFSTLRALGFGANLHGRSTPLLLRQLVALADVCSVVGHADDARVLYDALLPAREFCVSDGIALSLGAAARPLGELARQLGDPTRAELHFAAALERNRELGHRPELARTRVGLARVSLELGQGETAGALLETACQEAREMGMTPLLEQARALQ